MCMCVCVCVCACACVCVCMYVFYTHINGSAYILCNTQVGTTFSAIFQCKHTILSNVILTCSQLCISCIQYLKLYNCVLFCCLLIFRGIKKHSSKSSLKRNRQKTSADRQISCEFPVKKCGVLLIYPELPSHENQFH